MAGRPRKMAARVARLEEYAHVLAYETHGCCPPVYLAKQELAERDERAALWLRAVGAALHASIELERLGHFLRQRSGFTGLSPFEELSKLSKPPQSDPGQNNSGISATRGTKAGKARS